MFRRDKQGMKRTENHWWDFRNEDLIVLGKTRAPLYIYNEETLNEILFDLSAMNSLSGLLYPYPLNFHPQMLRKTFELDAYFRCNSFLEVNRLRKQFPKLPPERIFFMCDHDEGRDCEAALQQGLHVVVRAETNAVDVCHTEKVSLYKTLSPQYPDIRTLVLGNDGNLESSAHMKGMDLTEIENYLEAIHDACPQFKLWLELPIHMVSYAGAMLMEALESGTADDVPCVRVHLPMEDALFHEIHGTTHQVVNLSRPDEERIILTRMTRQRKHAGNGVVYVESPCIVERGDILLLTHMGTYAPETQVNEEGRNRLPEWYLKARCMCLVRI